MPAYKSKADVEKKLRSARQKLKAVREEKPVNEDKVKAALKVCMDLQHVLDRWDAVNS